MRRAYDSAGRTVLLRDMVGGALSVYAAALIVRTGGTHVFVAEDRDAAAYLLNDFYALLDERQVYFFSGLLQAFDRLRYGGCAGCRAADGGVECPASGNGCGRIPDYLHLSGSSGRTGDRSRLDAARNRAGEGRRPAGDRRAGGTVGRFGIHEGGFRLRTRTVFAAWRYLRRVFLFREQTLPVGLFSGKRWIRSADSRFPVSFPPTG